MADDDDLAEDEFEEEEPEEPEDLDEADLEDLADEDTDLEDVEDVDTEEEEGEEVEVPVAVVSDEEEGEEEEDDVDVDDVEASLDEILKEKLVVGDEDVEDLLWGGKVGHLEPLAGAERVGRPDHGDTSCVKGADSISALAGC